MIAGVPGIGIGGVFYLVCAFFMPFIEIANTLRGRSSARRWRMVAQQFGILCCVVAAFWGTGWALKISLKKLSAVSGSFSPHLSHAALNASNFLTVRPILLSLGAIATVMAVLSVANYILDRKKRRQVGIVNAGSPGGEPG